MKHKRIRNIEIIIPLLLLLTPLRAITIVLLPFILIYVSTRFPSRLRFRNIIFLLIAIFAVSAFYGIAAGTTSYWGVLLSCIIFLPMIVFLCFEPICSLDKRILYSRLARPALLLLLFVDILGLIYRVINGGPDDYGWAYGLHYEGVHGLAMINIFVFLWYVMKLLYGHLTKKDWLVFAIIAVSVVGCGYGLGIICLFLAFAVIIFRLGGRKALLVAFLLLVGLYGVWKSPLFEYERKNVTWVVENANVRKVTMFREFYSLVKTDRQVMIIGTGPGGYNSRSTLLLSGDNRNFVNKILGNIEPVYYKKYIYPLWNRTFVSMAAHTDGTRNKPFSSMVSIWAEQGILFFLLFIGLYIAQIKELRKYRKHKAEYYYLLSLDIFMFISLVSHLWLETTEFLSYCLIRYFMIMSLNSGPALTKYEKK